MEYKDDDKQSLTERTPFWSSKHPEIHTVLGKSKYHFSGYHTQRISGDELIMDNISLLGQRLDGADLGALTITLQGPITARLAADGKFRASAPLTLTSGANTTTIEGEVAGSWARQAGRFTSLCVSATAERTVFAAGQGALSTNLKFAAA
ncbi:MAG: hypothetical protein WBX22_00330 [Silvibacterium sp.]